MECVLFANCRICRAVNLRYSKTRYVAFVIDSYFYDRDQSLSSAGLVLSPV